MKDSFRAQSAMEYLMTYGWSILIVSVVLGTLYQMGTFSSGSLSPKVPPGACRIVKTAGSVNLVGSCGGQLPKYVAQLGLGSGIQVADSSTLDISNSLTVSLWLNPSASYVGYACHPIQKWTGTTDANYVLYYFGTTSGQDRYVTLYANAGGTWQTLGSGYTLNPNTWYSVIVTYGSSAGGQLYVNGQKVGGLGASGALGANNQPLNMGYDFPGLMSNIQIYNTTLDAGAVQSLYAEGIGGAPQTLQNIVGWWPLNGDAKDYSGNNNNGAPVAVTYTAQYGK